MGARYNKARPGGPAVSDIAQQSPPPTNQCANLSTASAVFGVTITKLAEAAAAHKKLQDLAAVDPNIPVVVRVVFEPIQTIDAAAFERELKKYHTAVDMLRQSSGACVMGAIADSDFMHFYLREVTDPKWPDGYGDYLCWTMRLVKEMGASVDIWEVGNEVNGEWYGWAGKAYKKDESEEDKNQDPIMSRKRADMRGKIKTELDAAYTAVKSLRPDALTAITLLYNDDGKKDCTEFHEYKMKDWVSSYLTDNIRGDVDFVLLSYYENKQDCPQVTRSHDRLLTDVFVPLREVFRNDKTAFGFGEISYKQDCYKNKDEEYDDEDRNKHSKCRAGQKDYVARYYEKLDRDLSSSFDTYNQQAGVRKIKYLGGYFYWYFLQDMVLADANRQNPVYNALKKARQSFRRPVAPKRNQLKVH